MTQKPARLAQLPMQAQPGQILTLCQPARAGKIAADAQRPGKGGGGGMESRRGRFWETADLERIGPRRWQDWLQLYPDLPPGQLGITPVFSDLCLLNG